MKLLDEKVKAFSRLRTLNANFDDFFVSEWYTFISLSYNLKFMELNNVRI